MKLEITTYAMKILPETAQDQIYIKYLLGLQNIDDQCECTLKLGGLPANGGRVIEMRRRESERAVSA